MEAAKVIKSTSKITKISSAGKATVYDLTVKDTHRILANNFYTSNCSHPQISSFINIKRDKAKVTGANISVKFTDEFMRAVESDSEYTLRWPVDASLEDAKIKKVVRARDIWEQVIDAAWYSAEPGVLFWDATLRRNPSDIYADEGFRTISTNPCAELQLSQSDSCRLMVLNLAKFVKNPFTKNASFDFEEFDKAAQKAQRLMDDLVDLELEAVDNIISKVLLDPEPEDIKVIELDLWRRIKEAAKKGRRTGLGITALGDALAMLNIKYGSEQSVVVTEQIYKALALAAYRSTVKLAEERGPFPIFNLAKEKGHEFIEQIMDADPELRKEYELHGRRNIALTTTAPVGSVSILSQTTSGIEPVFMLEYKRRKKITGNDANLSVDFTDDMGDKWHEYAIYHHGFKQWMDVTGDTDVKNSPYWGALSADIDWSAGVRLQAAAQKWICHSISRTSNLPKSATHKDISKIYLEAWKSGCKGFTVYRDKSRSGVLLTGDEAKSWFDGIPSEELTTMLEVGKKYHDDMPDNYLKFLSNEVEKEIQERLGQIDLRPAYVGVVHAPKRPRELACDIHRVIVKGEPYTALVGLLDGKPYEIFCGLAEHFELPKKTQKGILAKNGKVGGVSTYNLKIPVEDEFMTFKDVVSIFSNELYGAFTRTVSLALRHGVPVNYICEQLNKDKHSDMQSFSRCTARVLKTYIPDGLKFVTTEKCPGCQASNSLVYQEGCLHCTQCVYSKCG